MNGQSNTTLHQQALSGVVLSNSLHIPKYGFVNKDVHFSQVTWQKNWPHFRKKMFTEFICLLRDSFILKRVGGTLFNSKIQTLTFMYTL